MATELQWRKALDRAKREDLIGQLEERLLIGARYKVRSGSDPDVWYTVTVYDEGDDLASGCDCPAGRMHRVCKHAAMARAHYRKYFVAKAVQEWTSEAQPALT